jgi:hypothetical protein
MATRRTAAVAGRRSRRPPDDLRDLGAAKATQRSPASARYCWSPRAAVPSAMP